MQVYSDTNVDIDGFKTTQAATGGKGVSLVRLKTCAELITTIYT